MATVIIPFSQTRIVEAIQYCVDLDIPLKSFESFISESDGQIDYSSLLEYGKKIAEDKMRRIGKRLLFLQAMQEEIDHAESCTKGQLTKAYLPERTCWIIHYNGTQSDPSFHSAMYRLISEVEQNGLHAGFNNGQLVRYTKDGTFSYLFIDLRETQDVLKHYKQILQIPGGEYLCTVSEESRAQKAPEIFKDLFKDGKDHIAVEVELFSEQFNYSKPVFELRCI